MRKSEADDFFGSRAAPAGAPFLDTAGGTGAPAGLPPVCRHIYEAAQRDLAERRAGKDPVRDEAYCLDVIQRAAERLGFELTSVEREEILLLLEREQEKFGVIQRLVDEPSISDIIISDYSTIAVRQGGRTLRTDLSFPTPAAYEAYVERLLQRAGAAYSTKQPIADGMIDGFARIHAVHSCICDTGPYLTIRLNRFPSVDTRDLHRAGVAPLEILNYLSRIVVGGKTLLVVGEVSTGKTTLARALSAEIPGDESVLVIEDTPEIRIEHPNVRYMTTRSENTDGAGRISPSECIRAGMRMAMNRIIFGEMRDAEAAEAFIDVCASGHPGVSTIHARSATEALTRLELFLGRAQRGVSRQVIQEQIATAVQVVCFMNICRKTGARRIFEIQELGGAGDGRVSQREMFRYECRGEHPVWSVKNRVSRYREVLEGATDSVQLASLPGVLELSPAFDGAGHGRVPV